ncbi:MAG: GntR family transcriptional regulator [Chloroflexi bacterium]|nr:GntR family transcriptional regulator [Chloroflexota bacterium]
MSERLFITGGYTRDRHWENIYHDLHDLYGPMIGIEGPTMWFVYKRHIQHSPDHLLTDMAWPSHKQLAKFYGVGETKLRNARERLEKAGLITVTRGRDLASQSQWHYDHQLLNGGKTQNGAITLSDLAALGIQNPARAMFIKIHDPLTFHPFCNKFNFSYSPIIKYNKWEMEFDDYGGRIYGPNRLLAAVRYIENNLSAAPSDRYHWPLITEEQIRSLLRCKDDDYETIEICRRMLQRKARIAGAAPGSILPDHVLAKLRQLGWQGDTAEVEQHFATNPQRVIDLLLQALTAATVQRNGQQTVKNPAALFRTLLRDLGEPSEFNLH